MIVVIDVGLGARLGVGWMNRMKEDLVYILLLLGVLVNLLTGVGIDKGLGVGWM